MFEVSLLVVFIKYCAINLRDDVFLFGLVLFKVD